MSCRRLNFREPDLAPLWLQKQPAAVQQAASLLKSAPPLGLPPVELTASTQQAGSLLYSCGKLRHVQKLKLILKYILAMFFVLAGLNHIINSAFYLKIVPPYLPWHLLLVYLSGVFEIFLGGLLLLPRFKAIAAWGLIALLIAVFPANIHMAVNHNLFPEYSVTALWLRLPLQFVLIAWAYWYVDPIAPRKEEKHG